MVILLIEDDTEIVNSLIPQFKERGFVFDAAFDGEAGLERFLINSLETL